MSTRILDNEIVQTQWPQTLSTVASANINVVITDEGTPVAALVAYQNFKIFQQALEQIQSLQSHVQQAEMQFNNGFSVANNESNKKQSTNPMVIQQEIESIQQLAKKIGDGWTNPKSSLEVLEEMREESACR